MAQSERAVAWAGVVLGLALAGMGTARADSLALVSGAGQAGLIGQPASQPIVVQARNVNGVAVAGRTIQWNTGNGFQLGAASSVTDANGMASVTFTYGNYGTTSITASDAVGGSSAAAPETSVGSDSLVVISGSGQAGQQNTVSVQPIVVELRNAAGVPMNGRMISWTDQTSYTQVAAGSSTTNASGRASMGFTYLQGPPAVNGATAIIRASNSIGGQTADAIETVVGFDLIRLVSSQTQNGLVGTAGTPVTVRVTDWSGSTPRAGVTVTWTERFGNPFVTLAGASSVTDTNGLATMNFQYTQPGNGEIEATYGLGNADASYVSIGSERINLLTPNNPTGSSGNSYTMTVEVHDSSNNPVVGRTLQWSIQAGGTAVLAGPSTVTNGSGQSSMVYTCGATAADVLSVVNTGAFNPAGSDSYDFSERIDSYVCNPTANRNLTLISGSGQTGAVGAAGAQPIVVELRDAAGAPRVATNVFWSAVGPVTLAGANTLTDGAGRASMSFTYTGPGQAMIEAGSSGGSTTYVQAFVAGLGVDAITVFSGDNQSGLPGTHSAQPLVLELRNSSGAPIAGRSINWNLNSPAGTASFDAPTSITDGAGHASMGFTFGSVAGIAGMEGSESTTGYRAEFHAITVGADGVSLISGNGQTGPESSAGALPLVVEVRDPAGAPVPGRTINWAPSAGSAQVNAPTSLTDGAGRASMGFTFGNDSSTIMATDAVTGRAAQFALTGFNAVNTAKIISGDGQAGLPGAAGAQPLVLEIRDASNLPSPGQGVAWSVVSGPATLLTASNVTDANGQSSATFNYGPTPGTSIIQAQDPSNPNGARVQATVTSLGNNQALSIVAGADQVVPVAQASEPLVVQLKDFQGQPVAGAIIQWTAGNGTLASATSTTAADGKASNIVTPTAAGAVDVQANSLLAAAAVSFTLNGSIATLPNLTPKEEAVAVAIDNLCPALANKPNLSPEEADLLARCRELATAAGLNPSATAGALSELLTDTAQAQSSAGVAAVGAQFQNIRTRLMALRSSSPSSSLAGLTFTSAGGSIAMPSLIAAFADGDGGDGTKPASASFSRWGFFASGNIGRGEQDADRSAPAFGYDIEGLTAGVDYRVNDDWVSGVALGFTRQDTDLAEDQGQIALHGWSLSAYSTRTFMQHWYLDGVLTAGRNQYTLERRIRYTLPTPGGGTTSIDQLATGKPGGDMFSAALTFGGDFNRKSFTISPYGQLIYSRIGFGAYEESLRAGPGSGLGLSVDAREITGLTGIVGTRMSWSFSADWGVWVPTLSLEWNHEFRDELDGISAHFTHDPTQTLISIGGQPTDADYLRFGLGMSIVLAHGRSGFFLYDRTVARDGQSQENLAVGIRIEF